MTIIIGNINTFDPIGRMLTHFPMKDEGKQLTVFFNSVAEI